MMSIHPIAWSTLFAALGFLAGCWVCRNLLRVARRHREEVARAREILARVEDLTARVATDVSVHNTRVKEINDELAATDSADSETVVTAVAKLVAINDRMQRRLAEAEAKLQEQSKAIETQVAEARTDALTGLPNRRALERELADRFAQFQKQGTPLSAILLDVDHFKRFNDLHGHHVGDAVLQGIARVLQRTMRGTDAVARYGGEEFVVILPGTSIDAARRAGERYRRAIELAGFQSDGKQLAVTASVGIAQITSDEQPVNMLRRADQALYASKQAGRNCAHWHDGCAVHRVPTGEEASDARGGRNQSTDGRIERAAKGSADVPAEQLAAGVVSEARDSDTDARASHEYGRTLFFAQVRQQIAVWKETATRFSVMLVQVDDDDSAAASHDQPWIDSESPIDHQILTRLLRGPDIVGHYHHACYALLLPDTKLEDALVVARRVRQIATRNASPPHGDRTTASVRIGVAEWSSSEDTVGLFQRTEAALSAAAKNGISYHDGRQLQWVIPDSAPTASPATVQTATR
jgi:diguanylate cyclase